MTETFTAILDAAPTMMTTAEGYAWGLAAREDTEAALADLAIDVDAADVPDGILEAIAHLPADVADAVVDGWYRRLTSR